MLAGTQARSIKVRNSETAFPELPSNHKNTKILGPKLTQISKKLHQRQFSQRLGFAQEISLEILKRWVRIIEKRQ